MYDELTGNLRAQATHFSVHDETSLLLLKAADAIEELDNKLNLHRQGKISHWIPATERLPKDNERVLVVNDDGKMMVAKTADDDWWLYYCAYDADRWWTGENGVIKAWMPLPEPPEEDKDGAE